MRIGKYFVLAEFERSETAARHGINNRIPDDLVPNVVRIATVLDVIRARFGRVRVNSGYRGPEVNARIEGSSDTSAHMWGGAADIILPDCDPAELKACMLWLAARVRALGVGKFPVTTDALGLIDQVIWEYGAWIHIGIAPLHQEPRGEILCKYQGTGYRPFSDTRG